MTSARKVIIDWTGTNTDGVLREMENLPPGRYVLVPENELDDADERELTAEEIDGLNVAIDARDGGDAGISLDDFFARRAARPSRYGLRARRTTAACRGPRACRRCGARTGAAAGCR